MWKVIWQASDSSLFKELHALKIPLYIFEFSSFTYGELHRN